MNNLTLLKDTLKKSNNNTENMLGILSSFETRLRKLEQTIVPVYNETENLRRRQESILKSNSVTYQCGQDLGWIILYFMCP